MIKSRHHIYSAIIRITQIIWAFANLAAVKMVSLPFYAVPLAFRVFIYFVCAALFIATLRDLIRPILNSEVEELDADIRAYGEDYRALVKRVKALLTGGRTS